MSTMCARACMMGNIFMRPVCVWQMKCNRAPSEWWRKGRTHSMQMCICVRAGAKSQQMPTLITSQSANGRSGGGSRGEGKKIWRMSIWMWRGEIFAQGRMNEAVNNSPHLPPTSPSQELKKRTLLCEGSSTALLSWGHGSTAGWVRDGAPRCSGRERPAVQAFPSAAAVLYKQRRGLRQPAGRMCGLLKSSDKLPGPVSAWQTQQQGRTMGMRGGHVGMWLRWD